MTQPDLFRETQAAGPAGDDRRTPVPSRPARGRRQSYAQRKALQRIAEQQARYDRTRSQTALQRLKDAVTDALRLGV